jgi:hypothetical protein
MFLPETDGNATRFVFSWPRGMDVTEHIDPERGGRGATRPENTPGRCGRILRSPVVAILLVAPFFGEALSGATPPLDLIQPWNLVVLAALYGSGALICREVARRYRLGLTGLCLLGAAYGVCEEGLIDRYWYYPTFWHDVGVGSYSVVWQTNLLLAVHLTAFHAAISICASVLVVERLFPGCRGRAWAGRRGLALAAVALGVLVPLAVAHVAPWPGVGQILVAGGLCVLLIAGAFLAPRLSARPAPRPRPSRRRLATIAFAATASHFISVYTLPSTGLPWPLAIAISLAPIALGVVAVRRSVAGGPYGPDASRVLAGMLAFFIMLDALVGVLGRYDMTVGALATALALRWLLRRDRGPATKLAPVTN